jgi:hypothetical protein
MASFLLVWIDFAVNSGKQESAFLLPVLAKDGVNANSSCDVLG